MLRIFIKHGGCDGPYGIKIEIGAGTQEGRSQRRASRGRVTGWQPGEEGQARRRETQGPQVIGARLCTQGEVGTEEDCTQGASTQGANPQIERCQVVGDAVVGRRFFHGVSAGSIAAAAVHAVARCPAASGNTTIAAASVDTVVTIDALWRQLELKLAQPREAVGRILFLTAEASGKQLGGRFRFRRFKLLSAPCAAALDASGTAAFALSSPLPAAYSAGRGHCLGRGRESCDG